MRNILFIIIATVTVLALPVSASCAVNFMPYYQMTMNQGYTVFNEGQNNFLTSSLSNNVGLLTKFSKSTSLITIYQLKYNGPSLKLDENQQLQERSIDHIFMGKFSQGLFNNFITLEGKVDGMWEFYRESKSKQWGTGLYDFKRQGAGLGVKVALLPFLQLQGGFKQSQMLFPNYKDLSAYLSSDTQVIAAERGLQDQLFTTIDGGVDMQLWKFIISGNYNHTIKSYYEQKVILPTGVRSATEKQAEISDRISFNFIFPAKRGLAFGTSAAYSTRNSNQNYQYFKSANDTSPVFIADYYDISSMEIAPFLSIIPFKNSKLALNCNAFLISKNYGVRQAQDAQGVYTGDLLNTTLTIYTVSLKLPFNNSTFFIPKYVLQTLVSNNKFEKFVKYNYTANYIGFDLAVEY